MNDGRIPMIGEFVACDGYLYQITSRHKYLNGKQCVQFDVDGTKMDIGVDHLHLNGNVWMLRSDYVPAPPDDDPRLRGIRRISHYLQLKSELSKKVDALAQMSERISELEQKVYDLTYANAELQKNQDYYYMVANKYIRQVEKIGAIVRENDTKEMTAEKQK